MKCSKCGSEIAPGQVFCSTCGTPVNQIKSEVRNQNLGGQQGFPPPPPPRKRGGVPVWAFLLTIILIVGILVAVYFLVLKDWDSDDDDSTSTSSSRKKNENNEEDDEVNNSLRNNTVNNIVNNTTNNTTNTSYTPSGSGSTYKVAVGDFTVKVPDKYIYDVDASGTTAIGDEAGTWIIYMAIKEQAYSAMNSSSFASYFTNKGYIVDKQEEKTINGTQVYILEVSSTAGEKELFAVVRINSMYTAAIEVVNKDYTKLNYDALNTAISIAATAEKTATTTTNLEANSTFDLTKLME